jgi:hypothetical protein
MLVLLDNCYTTDSFKEGFQGYGEGNRSSKIIFQSLFDIEVKWSEFWAPEQSEWFDYLIKPQKKDNWEISKELIERHMQLVL